VVRDDVFVFLAPETNVAEVRFFLDEEPDGSPFRTEKGSPFDLAGTEKGTAQRAKPFDTRLLAEGEHVLRTLVEQADGREILLENTFFVHNDGGF
jgi:hypothetical protein